MRTPAKRKAGKGPLEDQEDTKDSKQGSPTSIAAINDVGASMLRHMQQDPVWQGLRSSAASAAAVDAAWAEKMSKQVNTSHTMGDEEQASVLEKSMAMFSEGRSTLRPDGIKPLQKALQVVVEKKVEALIRDTDDED